MMWSCHDVASGIAMLPDEIQPTDSVPSDKSEGTQPKEDPDRIRREVFKRMFPDVPEKPTEQKRTVAITREK